MGSIDFLADFEFYMAVLRVGRGPIGFIAPLSFKWLDSQPEKSNMGPDPSDFHDFLTFQKSQDSFLTRYLSCLSGRGFQIRIFEVSGPNQKEPRRKVTQIRGGITSRSAFFACFVPI